MVVQNWLPLRDTTHTWSQIYAIFSVSLGGFTSSSLFGWSSPSIPLLISNSSHIPHITLEDASYFSVISPISTLISIPLMSFLMDLIGRKKLIMLMTIPHALSWIFVITAKNLTFLYISRILCGISDAVFLTTIPLYIAEVATPKVRGTWANIFIVMIYFGQLLINIIGSYCDMATTAIIFLGFPVLQFILVAFVPETPYFFIIKNKIKEAKESLQLLRWSNNVEDELKSLVTDVNRQISESGLFKDLFMIPVNRKALIICLVLRLSQHLGGISAIGVYTQYIFSLSGSSVSAPLCAIIYSGLSLLMCTMFSFVTDKFGRRYMMIFSTIGCTFALFVEGVYFYILFETDTNVENINWIPLTGMIWYVIASASGLGLLPHLMMGELFSASIKSKAVGLVNVNVSLGMILTPKLFQVLSASVGMYLPFFVFGFCTFLTTIFCYFYLPETKQKTLEEIQQMLMKTKSIKA